MKNQKTSLSELGDLNVTRRQFLRAGSAAGVAAVPIMLNLASIRDAAAFNATDYKAIVCLFMYGGNDYANTVVAYDDTNYNKYKDIRLLYDRAANVGIAHAKSDLAATVLTPTTPLPGGSQYALHPAMTGLTNLFNTGKAAVQLNVGPLLKPLNRAQFDAKLNNLLPPKLFSHNDQQSIWQSSSPEGSTIGWGGNIADLALSTNPQMTFSCVSVQTNAVFLSGDSAINYQVSTSGAIAIKGIKANIYNSAPAKTALDTILKQSRPHVLENEYNKVTTRSIAAETQVSSALSGVTLTTVFPADSLGDQMKTVARMIAARSNLGVTRQVFFVSIGGFDLHDFLISKHGGLLGSVSGAMTAFYNATVELGVQDKVTSFTASDFGRTLTSNGDGTDHGWGNHHFIVGGAVKGAAFYGTPPPISVGNSSTLADDQWHVGQGRLLPTTSVDQYAATLAKWFGVTDAEMPNVLPNIVNFGVSANGIDYPKDVGFMKSVIP